MTSDDIPSDAQLICDQCGQSCNENDLYGTRLNEAMTFCSHACADLWEEANPAATTTSDPSRTYSETTTSTLMMAKFEVVKFSGSIHAIKDLTLGEVAFLAGPAQAIQLADLLNEYAERLNRAIIENNTFRLELNSLKAAAREAVSRLEIKLRK